MVKKNLMTQISNAALTEISLVLNNLTTMEKCLCLPLGKF